jgi:Family of unknown function (DUF6112)
MNVFPDSGAVGGTAGLKSIVGALLTFVLIIAVRMIISAVTWALALRERQLPDRHPGPRWRLGRLRRSSLSGRRCRVGQLPTRRRLDCMTANVEMVRGGAGKSFN